MKYIGNELTLFREARAWKRYYAGAIQAHVRGRVLEVGAGLGGTTRTLCRPDLDEWVAIEPDPDLERQWREAATADPLPVRARSLRHTTASLPPEEGLFDTILYIDVLEHIQEDAMELANAERLLAAGGRIVVLSPAHSWLFSPFDESVGHCRRYDRPMLRRLTPPNLAILEAFYLDSCGMILSAANRLVLRSAMPNPSQIAFWNRWIIPLSRILDPLLGRHVGKTVIAVWQRA